MRRLVPDTVAPSAGTVIDPVGGVVSPCAQEWTGSRHPARQTKTASENRVGLFNLNRGRSNKCVKRKRRCTLSVNY